MRARCATTSARASLRPMSAGFPMSKRARRNAIKVQDVPAISRSAPVAFNVDAVQCAIGNDAVVRGGAMGAHGIAELLDNRFQRSRARGSIGGARCVFQSRARLRAWRGFFVGGHFKLLCAAALRSTQGFLTRARPRCADRLLRGLESRQSFPIDRRCCDKARSNHRQREASEAFEILWTCQSLLPLGGCWWK